MSNKRYFAALETQDKFKPGVVSENLRRALGLHRDKLPIWSYRMRVLGYPPGWMKEADMRNSVMPMLDGGQNIVDTPLMNPDITYNPEIFHVYPGFNAPCPAGVHDHARFLGYPDMQAHQQLDFALTTINRPRPVPFKRFKISKEDNDDEARPSTSKANDSDVILDSTETDDVEVVFEKDKSSDGEPATSRATAKETDDDFIKISNDDKASNDGDDEDVVDDGPSESNKSSELDKTIDRDASSKSLIAMGSPVPESYTQVKPPLEKWSENNSLSELIYFENLPNYTGVFDRMRGVIGNIRQRLFSNQKDAHEKEKKKRKSDVLDSDDVVVLDGHSEQVDHVD